MLNKNFAIRAATCLLLLCSYALPLGCDRQELQASDRHSPSTDGNETRLSGDSLVNLAIRVFLFRSSQVQISCNRDNWSIWDADESRSLARLNKGQSLQVRRQQGRWQLEAEKSSENIPHGVAASAALEIRPAENAFLAVGRDTASSYRGKLRLLPVEQDSFVVVNILDMEKYLEGVVGAEMPSYWYKAALRAQAIACRTYALYQMHLWAGQGGWDIGSTQASQVYGGLAAEHRRVSEVIEETRGVVLTYGREGQEKIFPAYYSSNCGGHTTDASAVFGENLPPLHGNSCPYCEKVAQKRHYRWSDVTMDKQVLSRRLLGRLEALSDLGEIVDIKVTGRSSHGRVEKLKLFGSSGRTCAIDAESFRLAVSSREKPLFSSWYQLVDAGSSWRFEDGRGWGHGVGLCQCGSQQMARLGKDCVAILQHYYPQSTLMRAY